MNAKNGALVAAAVATALLGMTGCGPGKSTDTQSVKCAGINECSGTGECASADGSTSCAGTNSCAGHGWITVPSAEECTERGGTVL
jgi:hypothetical protein